MIMEMNQHFSLTFSLVNFSKSASLSAKVQFLMDNNVPILVSSCCCICLTLWVYRRVSIAQVTSDFNQGYICCYLAPMIRD